MDLGPNKSSSMPHPIVFVPVGQKADKVKSLYALNFYFMIFVLTMKSWAKTKSSHVSSALWV